MIITGCRDCPFCHENPTGCGLYENKHQGNELTTLNLRDLTDPSFVAEGCPLDEEGHKAEVFILARTIVPSEVIKRVKFGDGPAVMTEEVEEFNRRVCQGMQVPFELMFPNGVVRPKLKEVHPDTGKAASKTVYGPQCPHCGGLTEQSVIPCPDGPKEIAPGVWQQCEVLHIGWACRSCSPTRFYQEAKP